MEVRHTTSKQKPGHKYAKEGGNELGNLCFIARRSFFFYSSISQFIYDKSRIGETGKSQEKEKQER